MTPRLPPKHLRVFFARRAWVRESLYRHQGCFEASELWAIRPSGCWSPLERAPRGEKLPKDCPTAEVLLEAKAVALHPKRYQSLLSKLSTREVDEAGKRSAGNRIGYQVIDRQAEDRQTGRNKADERWYPSRPCSVLSSGL